MKGIKNISSSFLFILCILRILIRSLLILFILRILIRSLFILFILCILRILIRSLLILFIFVHPREQPRQIFSGSVLWNDQSNQRHHQPGDGRFKLHLSGLLAHLGQFFRVFNLLDLFAQLARTSRRQSHSGLIAPLKKARRRPGKKREKKEPPPVVHPGGEHNNQTNQAEHQHNHAAQQPFSPFFYADIGGTNIANLGLHIQDDTTTTSPVSLG